MLDEELLHSTDFCAEAAAAFPARTAVASVWTIHYFPVASGVS